MTGVQTCALPILVTRDYAADYCTWVDAAERYFSDDEAANSAGYSYSEWAGDWYCDDDVVWIEEKGDYYPLDELGHTIMHDEVEQEYVTKETYEERLAEREQETQEAA